MVINGSVAPRPMVNNNDEARRALVERRRDKLICLSGSAFRYVLF
ncbi:hypothetical protein AB25_1704 [Escherichia coli 2-005-03_S1_C2]|nr:hypothetical protein AB53_1713 [Escherichia coli 2-005-03_S1_C3]EZK34359.1 hypothetical protein AB25_1704 [Escherichia coli 2-005-03_S1_C2]KDA63823.1 hypothetical protein AA99_1821 [Escherichia coli 2-052-05_S1_C1]KDT13769.1 hypothetical protein AB55_1792 [Escherichia coli 2-052-05_S1_C3]KDW22739.1 hypothetical protein AB01_1762 [Escherichia coli 2-177-06_S1_C1]KDW34586.1 hypothetical protein AB29_1768 [Escherichia coli 2-177-06_S1_C2]KDW41553.1 hypothetical protein AB61_1758 [Escherichia 